MPQMITLPTSSVPTPPAVVEAYARYQRAWKAHDDVSLAYMAAVDAVPRAEAAEEDDAIDDVLELGVASIDGNRVEAARAELDRLSRLSLVVTEARARAERELGAALAAARDGWVAQMEEHELAVRARYREALADVVAAHRDLVEARALPTWLDQAVASPGQMRPFDVALGERFTSLEQHGQRARTAALVAELVADADRAWSSPTQRAAATLAEATAALNASGAPIDPSMRGEGQGPAGWRPLDRTTKDVIAAIDEELAAGAPIPPVSRRRGAGAS